MGMDKRERFAELFRAEYPGLVRELGLILGDRPLAEEVASEAFVELWRKWGQVSGFDRPGAWVRRVSLRKAGRARWRRGRRGAVEGSFTPTAPPEGVDIDLVRALGRLSEAQRTAVVMHHLGGWPAADIAKVLGCAEVTVRSHLSRGRRQLATLLENPNSTQEVEDAKPS
ncbi:SigE family RNA polymerase sigma factor [soil metagenome]